jgi:hypothetical protein
MSSMSNHRDWKTAVVGQVTDVVVTGAGKAFSAHG